MKKAFRPTTTKISLGSKKRRRYPKRPLSWFPILLGILLCLLSGGCFLFPPAVNDAPEKAGAGRDVGRPFGISRGISRLSDALEETCRNFPRFCRLHRMQALSEKLAVSPPDFPKVSLARLHHDALQAAVENAAQKYGAVGIQAAVIERGVVTDTYAWGWATRDTDPMTANHKIRVASLSKVVLGMAAMCLWEEGVLDPDEDISRYWDCAVRNPAYPDSPVTIRSILSHTSSIYCAPDDVSLSFSSVQKSLQGSGYSRTPPGAIESWCYNNYAFDVLGITLELASGQSVDAVLEDHFYRVMDIDAAFAAGDIRGTDMLATLYRGGSVSRTVQNLRARHCRKQPSDKGSHFCGTLTVSARDLAKLVAMLAGDGAYEGVQLFSPDSVEWMETLCGQPPSEDFFQALPLRYREDLYGRGRIYYHTGSAFGVYNCISYDPDTGDGAVVLTVGAGGSKDEAGIYRICSAVNDAFYAVIAPDSSRVGAP